MSVSEPLQNALAIVSQSPDYRILARIPEGVHVYREAQGPTFRGAVVDIETTGVDAVTDKIIEIGIVAFEYDAYGVTRILDAVDEREDPGQPLPPEITRLTGITDADLAGKRFDGERLLKAFTEARFLIAHNAQFDRTFLETRFPMLAEKPWACSQTQIPWTTDAAMGSAKLEYLVMKQGGFYEAHRAETDCRAVLHLLSQNASWDPKKGTIFSVLRAQAVSTGLHVWFTSLPFSYKDEAKQLGCVWNDGTKPGTYKAWHKEVKTPQEAREALAKAVEWYRRPDPQILVMETAAKNRFSARHGSLVGIQALIAMAEVPTEEEDLQPC